MVLRSNGGRSQLFTLRVWPEEVDEGETEWRGKLQRVVDGDTFYFRDWGAMLVLLRQILESPDRQSFHQGESESRA